MLVLQGAQDIQVVDADWQRWKTGFHDDPQVEFKLYPTLNHPGIAVEGESGLAQYKQPGHVDPALIGDVAEWIHTQDAHLAPTEPGNSPFLTPPTSYNQELGQTTGRKKAGPKK